MTERELYKIFSWRPYRDDWPIDRNEKKNNIEFYYGSLIDYFIHNQSFNIYQSSDSNMGNYLEFICYPHSPKSYKGNCIIVCISLCCPYAVYGQTTLTVEDGFIGWGGLFAPEATGIITDESLKAIERQINTILSQNNISLLDALFVSNPLPAEIAQDLKFENHNEGDQFLHGIFQKID